MLCKVLLPAQRGSWSKQQKGALCYQSLFDPETWAQRQKLHLGFGHQHGAGAGVVESVASEFATMSLSLICRTRFHRKLETYFAGKSKQWCKNAGPKVGPPGGPSFGDAAPQEEGHGTSFPP